MKNSQELSEKLHSASSELMIAGPRDCFECRAEPRFDFLLDGFILVCPICGCSINPQPNATQAILAWDSKQKWLEAEVWREYER